MSWNDMNIYATCRKAAGMTQERAAELLGVATRTLAAWESGERIPSSLRVADMVDLYATPVLAIQHLRLNSALAPDLLPEVRQVPLSQAVCQLCASIRRLQEIHAGDRLIEIAADGQVDEIERPEYDALLDDLEPVIAAVLTLRCVREEARG